jgi:methylenetetrahydrofolate dehydrogenase (NADP+)/methenyltetrahydrofolate cyclohydrolase
MKVKILTATILSGAKLAEQIRNTITAQIQLRLAQGKRAPVLAVVLVGDNPASKVYVKNKKIACAKVGIVTLNYDLPTDTKHTALLDLIRTLNNDPKVDGILVQLPLPQQINTAEIIENIDPNKDVDGFHPYNLGCLAQGRPNLRPCTPAGIMLLLAETKQNWVGKIAVVIGRSNIVGLPMTLELMQAKLTVTSCSKETENLAQEVQRADLLVVATGNPELIKGAWIKPGSTIIDVGMNRTKDGKLIGDVEFETAKQRAGWITPVPGGVGPMTIAALLQNTLRAVDISTMAARKR